MEKSARKTGSVLLRRNSKLPQVVLMDNEVSMQMAPESTSRVSNRFFSKRSSLDDRVLNRTCCIEIKQKQRLALRVNAHFQTLENQRSTLRSQGMRRRKST